MKKNNLVGAVAAAFFCLALLYSPRFAGAHCDTLDGPVVQDARKALETKDVTPVLKWVRAEEEKSIKNAFNKALGAQGKKNQQAAENKFFESLVKVHRAGEGAPFTGLKPAGEIEPVIAEADKALTGGNSDGLVKMVTETVSQGIRQRYEKVAEALKHKDESIKKGREYVEAYVDYTHYVERIQQDAERHSAHHKSLAGKGHKHGDGHEKKRLTK